MHFEGKVHSKPIIKYVLRSDLDILDRRLCRNIRVERVERVELPLEPLKLGQLFITPATPALRHLFLCARREDNGVVPTKDANKKAPQHYDVNFTL